MASVHSSNALHPSMEDLSVKRTLYREVLAKDAADQAEIFYHAVMTGAASTYTLDERKAWASALPREACAWAARHPLLTTLVAVRDGRCVGFVELDTGQSRIETLYVWPSLAGRGIGTALLEHAAERLRVEGHAKVDIEASLLLADRLERLGWTRQEEQWVERGGMSLKRIRFSRLL